MLLSSSGGWVCSEVCTLEASGWDCPQKMTHRELFMELWIRGSLDSAILVIKSEFEKRLKSPSLRTSELHRRATTTNMPEYHTLALEIAPPTSALSQRAILCEGPPCKNPCQGLPLLIDLLRAIRDLDEQGIVHGAISQEKSDVDGPENADSGGADSHFWNVLESCCSVSWK